MQVFIDIISANKINGNCVCCMLIAHSSIFFICLSLWIYLLLLTLFTLLQMRLKIKFEPQKVAWFEGSQPMADMVGLMLSQ